MESKKILEDYQKSSQGSSMGRIPLNAHLHLQGNQNIWKAKGFLDTCIDRSLLEGPSICHQSFKDISKSEDLLATFQRPLKRPLKTDIY